MEERKRNKVVGGLKKKKLKILQNVVISVWPRQSSPTLPVGMTTGIHGENGCEWETWGDNASWDTVWNSKSASRESGYLTAWENLEVTAGVMGPKDRAHQPLTHIPLLANIPVQQVYWLLWNNNCQTLRQLSTIFGRWEVRQWIQKWKSKFWCLTCEFDLSSETHKKRKSSVSTCVLIPNAMLILARV